jgi:hypothetical protein
LRIAMHASADEFRELAQGGHCFAHQERFLAGELGRLVFVLKREAGPRW